MTEDFNFLKNILFEYDCCIIFNNDNLINYINQLDILNPLGTKIKTTAYDNTHITDDIKGRKIIISDNYDKSIDEHMYLCDAICTKEDINNKDYTLYKSFGTYKIYRYIKTDILLSIIVLTMSERKAFFDRLMSIIRPQLNDKIQLVVMDGDEKPSIPIKRNRALQLSKGKYVWHVDDDDLITDDAVKSITDSITDNDVDAIVFNVQMTTNGMCPILVKYSKDYDIVNESNVYYRGVNTRMCVKLSVIDEWFKLVWNEDDGWGKRMKNKIKSESRIDKVLYYFDYRTNVPKYYFRDTEK